MGKAAIVAMIKTAKCEMKDGVKLSEPQISKINDDTYAFTYKSDSTGKCTENGKTMDMRPMRASTLWVRNGDKWQAVWHGENQIMAAPAADKKDAKAAEPKKEEPKKEEAKKQEPKKDDKAAANANTAAKPSPKVVLVMPSHFIFPPPVHSLIVSALLPMYPPAGSTPA